MLRYSFIHVPGIGPKRELQIHRSGISTWDEFLAEPERARLPKSVLARAVSFIEESAYRLERRDSSFFDLSLPPSEKWRLWKDFSEEAVFLDIETTGMAAPFDYVTVVGLHGAEGTESLVRGENLFLLPDYLMKYRLVITFNGAQFDLPFIRYRMGDVFSHMGHIDLRFVLRRLGYKGGLKSIESQVGISRPAEVCGVDGFEAVLLWRRYLQGDEGALARLILYNREDVENLRPLMEMAYERLHGRFTEEFGI